MILRLGLGALLLSAAAGGAVLLACSSDTDNTAANTAPDAGTDSGKTDSGAADSGVGAPITTATANAWTWVDFPDSECANGSATGIGVNLSPSGSKDLLIYLEAGGACWEANTCFGGTATLGQVEASDLDGFDSTKFNAKMKLKVGTALDRDVADNPFNNSNIVYVPYCTGDAHMGDTVQTYTGAANPNNVAIHHAGRTNLIAFLKRIVPTFSDATRVTLGGSSAGGFGAAVNYERVRQAFGGTTRVDLIDDCGPPFPNADMGYYTTWAASWDLATAFPAGCTACSTDATQLIPYLSKTYPDARLALLEYTADPTIMKFFNISEGSTFRTDLEAQFTAQFDPTTNAKYFEVLGAVHTMFGADDGTTGDQIDKVVSPPTAPNQSVAQWLTAMHTDSASWASVNAPAPTH